jgi:hypothetical protein
MWNSTPPLLIFEQSILCVPYMDDEFLRSCGALGDIASTELFNQIWKMAPQHLQPAPQGELRV